MTHHQPDPEGVDPRVGIVLTAIVLTAMLAVWLLQIKP